jgi:cytosine/adenosine deaminase-related metal-dependent hydrolase
MAGAHISSTPVTEMQLGHGNPIALDPDIFGSSSLGIDCHSMCSSYMPTQMLTLLQSSRALRYAVLLEKDEWDAWVGPIVEDVLNLGTILGARASGLENEIGSLKVGKKADLVIFDAKTPAMLSVSKCHPVAAIVTHSSIRGIRTVIVDGIIREHH